MYRKKYQVKSKIYFHHHMKNGENTEPETVHLLCLIFNMGCGESWVLSEQVANLSQG